MLYYFFVFILGLVWGSFLNCFIYRLECQEKGEKISVLQGRSFCPRCHHPLGFFDLIPVFSFLFLKGRCRYCQKPISFQYPLGEVFTGFVFLLLFWYFPPIGQDAPAAYGFIRFLFLAVISCFLIVIFIYDLKHYLIPDQMVYGATGLIIIWRLSEVLGLNLEISRVFKGPLFAAILASAFFFLLWLFSRGRWLGFGDVKLAFLMGIFLGWPSILVALFFSFLSGAIIGGGLIIFGRKNLKSQIPFGPFLTANTFIALFWGKEIINWYLSVFS